MKRKMTKRYMFSIDNINIDEINKKYGLISQSNINIVDSNIPKNTTKISDLEDKKNRLVSFIDQTRTKKTCQTSTTDLKYTHIDRRCFWDNHSIPSDIKPIGCPIRYIPHVAVKSYVSEINNRHHSIKQNVISLSMEDNKNGVFSFNKKGYYETDGVFCSFNCCVAWIKDHYHNPLYNNSYELLLKMYNDMNSMLPATTTIHPSPSCRNLISYGGNLTISEFRGNLNNTFYVSHGYIRPIECVSIGWLYEKQIKF